MYFLVNRWRLMAEGVRSLSPAVAEAYERAANELEAQLGERDEELLSLAQASRESGYSPDHLGRLVRTRKLRNHGRPHAPRIRRGDLPSKPARLAS